MTVHDCPTCQCVQPISVDDKCAECGLDFMQLVHGNQGHQGDHEFVREHINRKANE